VKKIKVVMERKKTTVKKNTTTIGKQCGAQAYIQTEGIVFIYYLFLLSLVNIIGRSLQFPDTDSLFDDHCF